MPSAGNCNAGLAVLPAPLGTAMDEHHARIILSPSPAHGP